MILAEYKVVLETPKSVTAKQARKILSEFEHRPNQEIQTNLDWLVGNFMPVRVRVQTIRTVTGKRRR